MSINKLKETKIKIKPFVKLKNSVTLREGGGRESDRKLREREREINKERDRSWVMRPVKRQQASCGTISTGRSRHAILPTCLGLGQWSDSLFVLLAHSLYSLFLLFLSLSLSLGVCEFGNHLKVKQKCK